MRDGEALPDLPDLSPGALFDPEYYLAQRPDVRAAAADPLRHYLEHGATETGDPHPLFSTGFYLSQLPAPPGVLPLAHYLAEGSRLGITPHPLFDPQYYLAQLPPDRPAEFDPLTHYLEHGWRQGLRPHPLFDPEYYLSQRPDVDGASTNPLLHYLQHGATEQGDPHPLFDTALYRRQLPAPPGVAPLVHYLSEGRRAGLRPSPLFDAQHYLGQLPPDRPVELDPLTHYVAYGCKQGLQPHPLFDPHFYLAQLPPEQAAGLDPLAHYLQQGWREGIRPHPLFDPNYYLSQRSDMRLVDVNHLTHYLEHGWREGVRPHPLFDPEYYLSQLPEVRSAGLNPLIHYVEHGWKAEGDPHLLFFTSFYLDQALTTAGLAPLSHYLTEGWPAGLSPHPLFDPEFFVRRAPSPPISGEAPLVQYANSGWEAGLDPHPLFEASFYLAQEPKRGGFRTPLEHYLKAGWQDGIAPHPLFDAGLYLASNPDLHGIGLNPLVHFVLRGRAEGRRGTPADVSAIVRRCMDEGKLDRAAALHAAFAPIPIGTRRQSVCLPIAGLQDYAASRGLLVQEFPGETIAVPKPTLLGDDRRDLKSGTLACPPAFVCCLEDAVIIGGTRVAICADGTILHDEIERNQRDPDLSIKPEGVVSRAKDGWALASFDRRPKDRIREGVLLSCDHDANYFHWLVEVLPKLAMVDEVAALRHVPLLIRDDLHPNLLRALELANPHGRRIIRLRAGCAYRVDRLVYPSDVCRTVDRYTGPTAFDTDCVLAPRWLRMVADRITRAMDLERIAGDRQLFLTRHAGLRQISNISDLEFWFAARGFHIETFQEVSLDYQVLRSRQISTLVAATGAAVTNMMFCRPGCDIVVLMSSHRGQNPYVWQQLATAFGHGLKLVVGPRLFTRSDYPIHDDYRIDLEVLQDAVAGRSQSAAASPGHGSPRGRKPTEPARSPAKARR